MKPFARGAAYCPTCFIPIANERYVERAGQRVRFVQPQRWSRRDKHAVVTELADGMRVTCKRGHDIPEDFARLGMMTIGLVGPSQSMKTHFLAVVARDLQGTATRVTLDDDTGALAFDPYVGCARRVQDLVDTLFSRHAVIPRTQPDDPDLADPVRDPITMEMQAVSSRAVSSKQTTTYLSLFDAPGEKLTILEDQMQFAPYLSDAYGLLIFVATTSLPEVRPHLRPPPPEGKFADHSPYMIPSVATAIRRQRNISRRKKIDTRVAVVVSRADLLRGSDEFADFHGVLGPGVAGTHAGQRLAQEFVRRYASSVEANLRANFASPPSYFFASATDCSENSTGGYDRVQPWGCTEALLSLVRECAGL